MSTAARTGGVCMPCAQQRADEAHARYVAAHRVDVDRFAGIEDPVEIILPFHERVPHDPLKRQLPYRRPIQEVYRALTQADADRLLDRAGPDLETLSNVSANLAAHTALDLERCQRALLSRRAPCPAPVFRGAGPVEVEALFALLDDGVRERSTVLVDRTLSAIAWARSPRVTSAMISWLLSPPPWGPLLHWAPHEYATLAGDTVAEGAPRDLIVPEAAKLVAGLGKPVRRTRARRERRRARDTR